MLTQKRLKELFSYDPDTGEFTRKVTTGNRSKAGRVIGCENALGYLIVNINYKYYSLHRLVWLYLYGSFPKLQIDHRDRNRRNNKLVNLREVSNRANHMNCAVSKNNSSGFTGVTKHNPSGRWRAYVKINYKQIHLGLFDDINDAVKARTLANKKYGFHPNHGVIL